MSNSWDRQRKGSELEPMIWYRRFELYRQAGPDRKLLALVNEYREQKGQKRSNNVPGSWRRAQDEWQWNERAEAWDEYERQRIEVEFQEQCDEWRHGRFEDARKLREKARGFLTFPVSKRTAVGDDSSTYIIEPLSTSAAKDAAAILKIADELARTTTRETLPKAEVEHKGDDEHPIKLAFDLDNLNDAELERLGRIFAKIIPELPERDEKAG